MSNKGLPVTHFAQASGTITLAAGDLASCTPISLANAKAGEIRMSSDAITSIAWYSATEIDGTYVECYDAADAAISQNVTASKACAIAAGVFGRMWVKALPTGASGTAVVVTQT